MIEIGMKVIEIGMKACISKTISAEDILNFSKVTGDTNPLHLDEDFAQRTRFKGRIAHGMLGATLIAAVLGTKIPGAGGVYLSQSFNFRRPVRPGDVITATVEVIDWNSVKGIVKLRTDCQNGRQEIVIDGEAVLLVDSNGQPNATNEEPIL